MPWYVILDGQIKVRPNNQSSLEKLECLCRHKKNHNFLPRIYLKLRIGYGVPSPASFTNSSSDRHISYSTQISRAFWLHCQIQTYDRLICVRIIHPFKDIPNNGIV